MDKMLVSKIDQDGLYIEPVFFNADEELPSDLIAEPIPEGFYTPKWDGSKWVEGLTEEEIEALRNIPQEPSEIDLTKEELKIVKKRQDETENAVMMLMELEIMRGMM